MVGGVVGAGKRSPRWRVSLRTDLGLGDRSGQVEASGGELVSNPTAGAASRRRASRGGEMERINRDRGFCGSGGDEGANQPACQGACLQALPCP